MYPLSVRGAGTSAQAAMVWGSDLLVTATALSMVHALGTGGLMYAYGAMNVLAFLFTYYLCPRDRRSEPGGHRAGRCGPGEFAPGTRRLEDPGEGRRIMSEPRLIIFDCDGVLIDSEIVVCRLVSEAFTRLGHPLSLDDVIRRFAGRPEPRDDRRDRGATGAGPSPRVLRRDEGASSPESYATELRAVPGVDETLDATPHAVLRGVEQRPAEARGSA